MEMVNTVDSLKAGDVCVDCQQLGLEKHLRYFKLNLNGDTLLKCESNECMYPYNDDIYSSSDEEIEDDHGLQFIDDFIQQYKNEHESESDLQANFDIKESDGGEEDHFDLSFFNNFQNDQENLNNKDFRPESRELIDIKENVVENENQLTNSNDNLTKFEMLKENFNSLENKNIENINEFSSNDICNQQSIITNDQFVYTKEIENHLSISRNPNEYLPKIEISMENIEIFDNKNIENINENIFKQDFTIETVEGREQKQNINKIEQQLNTIKKSPENLTKTENIENFGDNMLNNDEINNENLSKQDFKQDTIEYIERKENFINSNENLQNIAFSIENIEFLECKNIENTNENQFITLSSLNSPKCEITTATEVEDRSKLNSDNNNEIISSFISFLEEPTNENQQNTKVEKEILSFTTLSNDSIKDYKPKIDIQSVETIKMDEPLYNILPKITNTQTTENSKQHSNTSDKISKETKRKYKPRIKTEKKSVKNVPNTSKICQEISNSTDSLSVKDTNSTCSSSTNSLTSDIPKANIIKGAELLKKLALADEKNTKLSTKMKAVRNNKKSLIAKDSKVKVEEPNLNSMLAASPANSESDFSLDNIAEILIANKMKRKSSVIK